MTKETPFQQTFALNNIYTPHEIRTKVQKHFSNPNGTIEGLACIIVNTYEHNPKSKKDLNTMIPDRMQRGALIIAENNSHAPAAVIFYPSKTKEGYRCDHIETIVSYQK